MGGGWTEERRAKFAATMEAKREAKGLETTAVPPAAAPANNGSTNGVSREMYLIASDTAEELGVSLDVLARMRKELGVGTDRGQVRTFTAKDIAKLRALKGWMTELEVTPAIAAKIMRKVAKLKQSGAALPGA